MSGDLKTVRRRFITAAAIAAITGPSAILSAFEAKAQTYKNAKPQQEETTQPAHNNNQEVTMDNIKQIKAGVLDVGYAEFGDTTGTPVILLHGWPYDIHGFAAVSQILAKQGLRVIVPHLRGHGSTRFLAGTTSRSGQQAAIGQDVIALMDALKINRAVLAGYDWGGRAACVAAALWPERCIGLVSVNSYLIQDISKAAMPIAAKVEAGFWYQFYFLTERGKTGLTQNKRDIVAVMWSRNSPKWHFSQEDFNRSMLSFDNPDYVDITIHSYRHRLGAAPGFPEYAELERKLALLPAITVPAITLDGDSDGVIAATDGKSTAAKFTGGRIHRIIAGAGHNLPQENPEAFAQAVLDIVAAKKS